MASAVGLSVLDVIKEERCQENSLEVGTYLLQRLVTLVDKYEIVGDVRGKGLMIGTIGGVEAIFIIQFFPRRRDG